MNVHKVIHGRLVGLIIVVLILAALIPIGVTLAQSGENYRLTTMPLPPGEGTSSGGDYVLTQIETWRSLDRSRGQGYLMAPFTPEEPQANICVHLPLVLKNQ
jgi:hypothetical protein